MINHFNDLVKCEIKIEHSQVIMSFLRKLKEQTPFHSQQFTS